MLKELILETLGQVDVGKVTKNRRQVVKGGLAAGFLLLTLGPVGCGRVLTSREEQDIPKWYKRLANYRDRVILLDLEKEIIDDLVAQKEYPSIWEAGDFLAASLKNPNIVRDYYPAILPPPHGILIEQVDLGDDTAYFRDAGAQIGELVTLKERSSGKVLSFTGVRNEQSKPFISLHSDLIEAGVAPWTMRVLIAKAASHYLDFPVLKAKLLSELRVIYDVPSDTDLENVLFNTSLSAGDPRLQIPKISPLFNNMVRFAEYTGYGRVALDLAALNDRSFFREVDQKVLALNLASVKIGQEQGLILKDQQNPGRYIWKEGVSSVSQEWFRVVEEVYSSLSPEPARILRSKLVLQADIHLL